MSSNTPSDLPPAALHAATSEALERAGVVTGRFTLDVRAECVSTNSTLLDLAEAGAPSGTVLIAQHQSAGRGRRGRQWVSAPVSAPGDSLTFSLLWRFAPGTAPGGLSLAVGLALVRALDSLLRPADAATGQALEVGAGETAYPSGMKCPEWGTALALKWPNDILLGGRKLAGVLVELIPGATHAAVIGIGLNRRLPETLPEELKDIAIAWPGDTPAATLLATMLVHLDQVLAQFAHDGFAMMRNDWQRFHAHQDQQVSLLDEFAPPRHGICRGVAPDGALLLETAHGIEQVLSGDVSLRACAQ